MKVWKGRKHVRVPAPADGIDWPECGWKGWWAGDKSGDQEGRGLAFTLWSVHFANSNRGGIEGFISAEERVARFLKTRSQRSPWPSLNHLLVGWRGRHVGAISSVWGLAEAARCPGNYDVQIGGEWWTRFLCFLPPDELVAVTQCHAFGLRCAMESWTCHRGRRAVLVVPTVGNTGCVSISSTLDLLQEGLCGEEREFP